MPKRKSVTGSELFIVDNSDEDWKVLRYLHDWCQISKSIDIATGYFEIGSLLALKDEWQKVDKIRILMGDEVSRRTKNAFVKAFDNILSKLDNSIEIEKQANDFLAGVSAIVEAIRSKKIECKVYRKDKFHAKAYITNARLEVVGSSALVGSSNFTFPGITENIELNVQITGRPVTVLQEWYEEHWDIAEDASAEILRTIERHTREYSPFEVYAKSLLEFFRGHELTAGEWELSKSRMYPVLDQYQKEGYQAVMKIANQYNGAFLCDGVGLGKTFIGLMVIERLVEYERKRVALFVPKTARGPVWEQAIRRYLPQIGGDFSNLVILNHTDLLRSGEFPRRLQRIKEMADVIVIDEAHHFRNAGGVLSGATRYWNLFNIAENKPIFYITATPVNNSLKDFQHMIELFSRRKDDYFKSAPLGIHSLRGHFIRMDKALERQFKNQPDFKEEGQWDTNQVEAEQEVLFSDTLFKSLVVQRSRAYVKESQKQHSGNLAIFPTREPPIVADYSVKKTYGKLLTMVEQAFSKEKPLFSLAIYYPLAYYKGADSTIDPWLENRQRQLVRLIRVQFLKRFESSAYAFEMSCESLLIKLLAWVTKHVSTPTEKKLFDRWKAQHHDLIQNIHQRQHEILGTEPENEFEEDVVSDEMLEDIEELSRDEYKVDEIIQETFLDMDEIVKFLDELKKFKPSHDDKLKTLIRLLKTDSVLKQHKVLIFTEFMATARYLKKELAKTGIKGLDEVDSAVKRDRGEIIKQFAPYYNDSSSKELAEKGIDETRVLISTDVLSEGLNLQDATRLINYDLHWNPVRLMQRIGRVDRRLNPEIEKAILTDHPEVKDIRGNIAYWNFLPPDELDILLRLYQRVSRKTLLISKVFGIEGKKLLTPQDDYEAMKNFNHIYEGTTTPTESMHLEYQKLLQDYPDLQEKLAHFPGRVFSGKQHPKPDTKSVFFCYSLPAPSAEQQDVKETDADVWTEEAGFTKWYLYDLATEKVVEEPSEIINLIRSTPDTPRFRAIADTTLSELRVKIDKYIKNTYLKQVQAPIGVKAKLKAWMELS